MLRNVKKIPDRTSSRVGKFCERTYRIKMYLVTSQKPAVTLYLQHGYSFL